MILREPSRDGRAARPPIRRVAVVSLHTSPFHQPGTGDAGGMNVYVVELARRLAALGIEVDVFTRATSSELPPAAPLAPGATVRHIAAGPYEGLRKEDLPDQVDTFADGVLRAEAERGRGSYDAIHSHYWLSGQVGWLAKERWGVPLIHSMHTMAKVKNSSLADGDVPEPVTRETGEQQVVDVADRVIAHTGDEAGQLVDMYGADPGRVATIAPGVDLTLFRPGSRRGARRRLGVGRDAVVLLFVGRIQPLKGPDVLLRAAAHLAKDPRLRERLVVAFVGAPSGSGTTEPERVHHLAGELGIADVVRTEAPGPQEHLVDWYRAATATVVPSYSESFGLAALESQASGTPVVASSVGGLPTAVADGESGVLVGGHDPARYAGVLRRLARDRRWHDQLSAGAVSHAAGFGWAATVTRVLDVYRAAKSELAGLPAPLPLAAGE